MKVWRCLKKYCKRTKKFTGNKKKVKVDVGYL